VTTPHIDLMPDVDTSQKKPVVDKPQPVRFPRKEPS